jgi:hypothetical protein
MLIYVTRIHNDRNNRREVNLVGRNASRQILRCAMFEAQRWGNAIVHADMHAVISSQTARLCVILASFDEFVKLSDM